MPPTNLQIAHLSQSAGTSLAVTFAAPPRLGSVILVAARDFAGGELSCVDNQGNAYSTDYHPDSGAYAFSATVGTTGSPFTVTVSGTASTHHVYIVEVDGITRVVDAVMYSSGVGGSMTTGVSPVTAFPIEYVFAWGGSSSSGVSFVPTVGIDLGPETGISRSSDASYRVTSVIGTQSETWTGTPTSWAAWLVSYVASPLPTFQMSSAQ